MFSIPARTVAIVMAMVVVSFLATLWLTHRRLDAINQQVRDLEANANPSIEQMTAARAELRRLAMHAHSYLEAQSQGDALDRSKIDGAYRRLRLNYRAQADLPSFPGEIELQRKVDQAIDPVGVLTERVVREVDEHHLQAAHRLLTHEFSDAIDVADDAMSQLTAFNRARADERVEAIQHARRSSTKISWYMSSFSIAIAMLSTVLVFRALRSHARLAAQRDRLLEERAAAMETFAYRVAHDLRGPLAGLALRLAVAEDTMRGVDQMGELGRRLRGGIRRMNLIIDGLLEFARAGATPDVSARTDVAQVVAEVVNDVQPEAAGAAVSVDFKGELESFSVACSHGVVTSIVSNLVRNAIKFVAATDRLARHVRLSVRGRDTLVRVEVEDNGPGIPNELRERIFDPFVRATDRPVAGIGLGLATVKRLVVAHGGETGVRSELGSGSCFWFELPKAPEEDAADSLAQPTRPRSEDGRMRKV